MLKIESLTRRYPHVTALDGLNMEIGHGQLYGFVANQTVPEKRPRSESYPDYCDRLQEKCGSMVSGQKRRHAS